MTVEGIVGRNGELRPQVVILVPTQELVVQVAGTIAAVSPSLGVLTTVRVYVCACCVCARVCVHVCVLCRFTRLRLCL